MREVYEYNKAVALCRYKWKIVGTRTGFDYVYNDVTNQYDRLNEYDIYILERK